jgi:hypothetical protein
VARHQVARQVLAVQELSSLQVQALFMQVAAVVVTILAQQALRAEMAAVVQVLVVRPSQLQSMALLERQTQAAAVVGQIRLAWQVQVVQVLLFLNTQTQKQLLSAQV